MTCDKKLYSTVIYSRWIKEADKDFDAARRVLEYEMLMSNNFTAVNCVRTLFCCRKTQNYQVMNEILNLMGDFCKDHPYVIASHIIKMVHSNAEHTEIENFINKNIEKTSENNLECIYENIADAYIETNSVKEAYKIINKALCRFPHSTIFNKIYPHNNCNNKLEFLKHFISENQDFSFLIQRACIEYLNICKSEANYSFAIDFLNIHSGIFPDNNIPIKLKANLYSRMGKFYDAYTLYKKLPDAFYIDNCDTLYLYAHTLYKLNYSEKLYALFKKCLELNLLNKGSKLIILFLDFFYSQLNLKPLSLSLSLNNTNSDFYNHFLHLSNTLYNIQYRQHKEATNTLYIILSHDEKFMCYKNKLNGNILFVSSNYCSWYTLSPFIILNAIKKYISRDTKIFILGSSKAGFGSLLLGHLLGNSCDNEIFILAFSPQIVIYPFSENVASFSKAYIEYYKDIAEFKYCHDSVLQFGNINNLFSQKKHNINAFIYVGEDLDHDMKEINTIINFNTCHICIMPNVDSHFTLMFFYRDQNYFSSSLKDLNTDDPRYKLFKKFNEIKQKNNYSLNDIIEESLKKNVLKLEK